jgi:hypothetical protein
VLAGTAVAMLLTIAPPPAPIIHDAQVAVLSQLPAELGSYFKYYCVAIAPGTRGQVEVVSSTHVRVVVLTTSGFLTETYTLYDLERDDARWRITASVIMLQS